MIQITKLIYYMKLEYAQLIKKYYNQIYLTLINAEILKTPRIF